jgi:hypothetical protein
MEHAGERGRDSFIRVQLPNCDGSRWIEAAAANACRCTSNQIKSLPKSTRQPDMHIFTS